MPISLSGLLPRLCIQLLEILRGLLSMAFFTIAIFQMLNFLKRKVFQIQKTVMMRSIAMAPWQVLVKDHILDCLCLQFAQGLYTDWTKAQVGYSLLQRFLRLSQNLASAPNFSKARKFLFILWKIDIWFCSCYSYSLISGWAFTYEIIRAI